MIYYRFSRKDINRVRSAAHVSDEEALRLLNRYGTPERAIAEGCGIEPICVEPTEVRDPWAELKGALRDVVKYGAKLTVSYKEKTVTLAAWAVLLIFLLTAPVSLVITLIVTMNGGRFSAERCAETGKASEPAC